MSWRSLDKINLILSNSFEIWWCDMWVMLMSNCSLVRILVLRFVIPYASTKESCNENYILLVVHYSVLIMFNACLWDYSFLGWSPPNLLLAFILHQVWSLFVHPKSFKPVLLHEPTISTYMRYSFAVLSKFACAISNFQNKFLFCVLVPIARRWGMADVFHARCVILTMSVYPLVIARE